MAETLKLGNGEWATKENSLLSYNDENGNYKPLPFDFTRASSATVVNKAGLIETVQSGIPRIDFLGNTNGALKLEPQRTNLITQSEAFGNTYWTKVRTSIEGDPSTAGSDLLSGWDFTSGWLVSGTATIDDLNSFTNTATNGGVRKEAFLTIGKTYICTITGTTTATSINIMNFGSVTQYTNITGGGAFSKTFQFSSIDTGVRILNQGTGTTDITTFTIQEVQGFTSPSADSPLNAFKLVEDTSTGTHITRSSAAVTNGISCYESFFVKSAERSKIGIREGAFTGDWATFNLTTGTIIDESTTGNAYIEGFGNGWYRVGFTFTSGGTYARFDIALLDDAYTSGSSDYSYQGDGTSGVYIFGAQLEQSSYPTSYIPTQGSTVTRNLETCSQTVPDGVIGQTEGSIYTEYYFDATIDNSGGSDRDILSINDGTSSNVIQLIHYGNGASSYNKKVYLNAILLGSYVVSIGSPVQNSGLMKVACGYKNNDYVLYVNGVQIGTDTSAGVPSCSVIKFAKITGIQTPTPINDVKLYNTRLSNSELQALTN